MNQTIKMIIIVLLIFVGLAVFLLVSDKLIKRFERWECVKWKQESKEFEGWYSTNWQKNQCQQFNTEL